MQNFVDPLNMNDLLHEIYSGGVPSPKVVKVEVVPVKVVEAPPPLPVKVVVPPPA